MQGEARAFWSDGTLKIECPKLIQPFNAHRVKHCAYELCVGDEAYITSNKGKKSKINKDNPVIIPPGQFGLILTAEVIQVPANAMAFISIRAGVKFRGLVNVSGFHVDPGYNDRLMFAVYNAGSQDIVLDYLRPTFMIWYASLDADVHDPYPARTGEPRGITDEDIMRIQGEVASPGELKKQVEELKVDLEKKFHSTEQSRLYNRSLITFLVGIAASIIVVILSWALIKPTFDGGGQNSATAPVAAPPNAVPLAAQPASASQPAVNLPWQMGLYILGAGTLAGAGPVISAWIFRTRKP